MNYNGVKNFIEKKFDKLDINLSFSEEDSVILELTKELGIGGDINLHIQKHRDYFTFYPIANQKKIDCDLLLILYIGKKIDSGFITFYFWDLLNNKTNLLPILASITNLQPKLDKSEIIKTISSTVKSFAMANFNLDIKVILNGQSFHFERIDRLR